MSISVNEAKPMALHTSRAGVRNARLGYTPKRGIVFVVENMSNINPIFYV